MNDARHHTGFLPERGRRSRPVHHRLTVLCAGLLLTGLLSVPRPGLSEVPLFDDVSDQAAISFTHHAGMQGHYFLVEIMGPGAGWLDYDGDGDLDLYLVQGQGIGDEYRAALRDRLFRNDSQGNRVRFVDVTSASGIDAQSYGMGVAVADYDNDGDEDLYVTNWGANQLWQNQGNGRFTNVADQAGVADPGWSTSSTFVDLNRDGWLDLYVVNYVQYSEARHKQCFAPQGGVDYCGPNAYPSAADQVFLNQGDGRFKASTPGIPPSQGLAVAAADFNGNQRPDIFVANDGAENFLWINQGKGQLLDDALLAGVAVNARGKSEASMGIAVGDYDGDQDLDLFLTHLNTETNTLYRNLGNGLFEDATDRSGLATPSWRFTGFGARFVDVDHDRDLDLIVANGEVTRILDQQQADKALPFRQPDQLFLNTGAGQFVDASNKLPPQHPAGVGRAIASADFDNDGDTDLLISNTNEGPRLWRSNASRNGLWLGLDLRLPSGRSAIGAQVLVSLSDDTQAFRHVHRDGSYLAASDPRVSVALDGGLTVSLIEIRWPDGRRSQHQSAVSGRYQVITQPLDAAGLAEQGGTE